MLANKSLLAGLAFLAFGLLTLVVLIPFGIQQPPSVKYLALSPSYWPNIVAGAITALGLALIVAALMTEKPEDLPVESTANEPQGQSAWLAVRPIIALAICFALYYGLEPLGFVLSTSIAVALLLLLAGETRPLVIVPIALIVPLGLHLFFTKAASVPIPMGILEPWLLRI